MTEIQSFYQFYPQLAAVVGTSYNGKTNYMAVAWLSGISHHPPVIGISISPKRFTHNRLLAAKEFNCNFLPFDEIKTLHGTGKTSGRNVDKIDLFEIDTTPGSRIKTPWISKSYAALECSLVDHKTYGDHTWIVGEVVHVHQQTGKFTQDGFLDTSMVAPVLYLGKNRYITVDPASYKVLPDEVTV